jgi:hypothetical protein
MAGLNIHPLAGIFPPMSDEAFAALVAKIRTNGLHELPTRTIDRYFMRVPSDATTHLNAAQVRTRDGEISDVALWRLLK